MGMSSFTESSKILKEVQAFSRDKSVKLVGTNSGLNIKKGLIKDTFENAGFNKNLISEILQFLQFTNLTSLSDQARAFASREQIEYVEINLFDHIQVENLIEIAKQSRR